MRSRQRSCNAATEEEECTDSEASEQEESTDREASAQEESTDREADRGAVRQRQRRRKAPIEKQTEEV